MTTRRNINVANIIEEGRWGGPQKRITEIAAKLRDHRIETTVILSDQDSTKFQNELKSKRVNYETIAIQRLNANTLSVLFYLIRFLPDTLSLIRSLRKSDYDLVHVSGGAWQVRGAIAGKLTRIPVVWHLNDTQLSPISIKIFTLTARMTTTAFFVAGHRTKEYYLGVKGLKGIPAYLTPAPVDTKLYNPKITKPLQEIIKSPGYHIVTIANISPIKGLETLIEAAALLINEGLVVTFYIVGKLYLTQTAYNEVLQEKIRSLQLDKIIVFLGELDNTTSALAAADLYICSSLAEASPMSVWEAMSMALPIVSTNVGDVPKFVKENVNGYIVEVGDSTSLANHTKYLLKNEALRTIYGVNSRKIAIEQLDVTVASRNTADLYEQIINSTVPKFPAN